MFSFCALHAERRRFAPPPSSCSARPPHPLKPPASHHQDAHLALGDEAREQLRDRKPHPGLMMGAQQRRAKTRGKRGEFNVGVYDWILSRLGQRSEALFVSKAGKFFATEAAAARHSQSLITPSKRECMIRSAPRTRVHISAYNTDQTRGRRYIQPLRKKPHRKKQFFLGLVC